MLFHVLFHPSSFSTSPLPRLALVDLKNASLLALLSDTAGTYGPLSGRYQGLGRASCAADNAASDFSFLTLADDRRAHSLAWPESAGVEGGSGPWTLEDPESLW